MERDSLFSDPGSEDDDWRKNVLRGTFKYEKAKFKWSTLDFIWKYLCCKCLKAKKNLRNSVFDRKVLNYRKGMDKLNKELDVGVILDKLR